MTTMTRVELEASLNIPAWAHLSSVDAYELQPSSDGLSSPASISLAASEEGGRCFLVGRNAANDAKLEHETISRRHAAFFFDRETPQTLYVMDLATNKGTYINGKKFKNTTMQVKAGDVLRFGGDERPFTVGIKPSLPPTFSTSPSVLPTSSPPPPESPSSSEDEYAVPRSLLPPTLDVSKMTPRQIREAEIKAMIDSLDAPPKATKEFGERTASRGSDDDDDDDDDDDFSGPHRPLPSSDSHVPRPPSHSDSSVSSNSIAEEFRRRNIPISNSVSLSGGSKCVGTLAVDLSGSRVVVGSNDFSLRLYDFGGMDGSHQPFKSVIADGSHAIVALSYNPAGSHFVCASSSAQPKVFTRDGAELVSFIKGDVYVSDVAHTKGHTSGTTGAKWHPENSRLLLTCSLDGSVREWDVEKGKTLFEKLICERVIRVKNAKGLTVAATAVAYSNNGGKFIACGTAGGGLVLWGYEKLLSPSSKPDEACWDAHVNGKITAVAFSPDDSVIATRGMDDCVKLWSSKGFAARGPLKVFRSVASHYDTASLAFSPDGLLVVAGGSVRPGGPDVGRLFFFDARPEEGGQDPVATVPVKVGASAVALVWHSKINQIVVGGSDGVTTVFYDPMISVKGALLSSKKVARRRDELETLLSERGNFAAEIITPHALAAFKDPEKVTKRKREKELMAKIPEKPAVAAKKSGGGTSFHSHALQQAGLIVKETDLLATTSQDPRESLFKYHNANPGAAPAVLAKTTAEFEQEQKLTKK